jgi:hypothetical protein
MLALKPGVDVRGIAPEILLGLTILAEVLWKHGIPTVVTSCRDGDHMVGSKHYVGLAVDVRLPSRFSVLPNIDLMLLMEARESLGEQYDLVLEKDHLHLEYDPRKDVHA